MDKMTFEEALKRIEEIVRLLESQQTSLEQSVELYQEGILLTNHCNKKLQNIEGKVAKIQINGEFVDFKEGE
ncbi:exodeoxyribonuclease VII small subunit [Tannockella kyphosi]|uniref:exodeoxyribonuclease VII small subunit n=1 Tax=Tannockella kyphosi TaxID=2899121 RepID=UPI002012445C|nr:exodeoxyribonuclease VII small subunit [Tannockella kyphosi]